MRRILMSAAAALAMLGAPAEATEYTRFSNLCLPRLSGEGPAARCASMALLNLPPSWQEGGLAVALLTETVLHDAPREPLVAALLDAGIAVLELVPLAMTDLDGNDDPAAEPDRMEGFLRALVALTRGLGAGTVIALGYGPGAGVALDAASEAAARQQGGRMPERFASAVSLGDGPERFVLGAGMAAQLRLASFCEAIHAAEGVGSVGRVEACYPALVGRGRPRPARADAALAGR
jgi:hypothetical protein